MDKDERNALRNAVTQCRRLLEEATGEQLEGHFGVHPNGTIEDTSRMSHLPPDEMDLREEIVANLHHVQATMLSGGPVSKEAVQQLVREVGFTHLNRLCAYKILEQRKLLREAVGRGFNSNGFKFFLADHPDEERLWSRGEQEVAYRHFLLWLGGTLSEEVGVLFSSNDPANRLFPPYHVLEQVLALINASELRKVWDEDEAIGWVYQYFTPKELRDKAHNDSPVPRNSYELAFLNQFYTPRYVVQFLVDNTLGRMWYEMCRGDTALRAQCQFLMHHPNAMFLGKGESEPQSADRNDAERYVPYREKKDPREIRVLDPACGSGHFLLYSFGLLQTIYSEAYDDADLAPRLKRDYPNAEQFKHEVPGLILRHNLHGIDIDLRATQIASLALWLRARRAFSDMHLGPDERPKIRRTNVVCAEPMPGEIDLLDEFVRGLQPTVLGQLARRVFARMRLASEAGSLLKIEQIIQADIRDARKQWTMGTKEEQLLLWPESRRPKPEQLSLFDVAGITDAAFWDEAQERLLEALRAYAENTSNGLAYARGLFAEDAAQGFGLVDLSLATYDVVLMNPPFGEPTILTRQLLREDYPKSSLNMFAAFILRAREWAPSGLVGAITDNTWLKKTDYADLRADLKSTHGLPTVLADLGWGVLDGAYVATCAFVLADASAGGALTAVRVSDVSVELKAEQLQDSINYTNTLASSASGELQRVFLRNWDYFDRFAAGALAYETPDSLLNAWDHWKPLQPTYAVARRGYTPGDTFRFFRAWWEVPINQLRKKWRTLNNGSPYAPVLGQGFYAALYEGKWGSYRSIPGFRLESADWFGRAGLGYGKRTEFMYAYPVPAGSMFSMEGMCIFPNDEYFWGVLAYLNSSVCQTLINLYCGQHKTAGYVAKVPTPDLNLLPMRDAADRAQKLWLRGQELVRRDETLEHFTSLLYPRVGEDLRSLGVLLTAGDLFYKEQLAEIDDGVLRVVAGPSENLDMLREQLEADRPAPQMSSCIPLGGNLLAGRAHPADLLQYCMGVAFGRWDVRISLDPSLAAPIGNPDDPLSACPPGMLIGANGLPAGEHDIVSEYWLRSRRNSALPPSHDSVEQTTIQDADYPVKIAWDGILVDDRDHPRDVVRQIHAVLELLWVEGADTIEQEVTKCRIPEIPGPVESSRFRDCPSRRR